MTKSDRHIRGIDDELYAQAKAAAAQRAIQTKGFTVGDWINEAMAEKLAVDRAAKTIPDKPSKD